MRKQQTIKKPFNLESFAAGKLKSILIGQPEDLEGLCFLLNSKGPAELGSELRSLIDNWQRSGPNLAKMLENDKLLAAHVRHGRTILIPTNTGRGHLLWLPTLPNFHVHSWKHQALAHFMDLIVNPQWHKLGGPCERCRKYYVKKTFRQKTYCSRRCGSVMTAAITTRKRREDQRTHKLWRAQEAANGWTTIPTRNPWKVWVSARTGITVKWLTRAANRGDLREPLKKGNPPR